MSRPYYDGYNGNMPAHHESDQDYNNYHPRPGPRNNNHSRIPRPPQSDQASMKPDYSSTASPVRNGPTRNQEQYYPQHSDWEMSQNMYNGSGYEEDYGPSDHYDQWPLPGHPYEQPQRGTGSPRRIPQRPQRPEDSYQQSDYHQPIRDQPRSSPHIVNAGRQYQHPQGPQLLSHHGNGQWTGDGYSYTPPNHPPPNRPPPQNPQSRQAASPTPHYPPQPILQQVAYARTNNQRAPLGPPPSARRGPAVYYPDVGPVHPIIEETDSMRSSLRNGSVRTGGHDSKTSFASSNAIPIGIPQVYLDNHGGPRPDTGEHTSIPEDVYEASDTDDDAIDRTIAQFERIMPPSRDQESPEVIVRQASIGKKSRPTLTNVKSGVSSRKSSGSDQGAAPLPTNHGQKGSQDTQAVLAETERSRALAQEKLEGQVEPGAHDAEQHSGRGSSPIVSEVATALASVGGSGTRTPEEVLKSGTDLLDASDSSESENEVRRKKSKELLGAAITKELRPQRSQPRSPLAPSDDERVKSILESVKKGGAITADDVEELKKPTGGLSEKSERRRPPRLDVGAVRDAEARGSLTSLPDLIMRATKLASNLDRGKTASRLGMNWFDGADNNEKRRSGSIADALNSFPLPYNATPPDSRGDLRKSMMSARHRHSALPSESDSGEAHTPKRRCCGMPLWLFILLMVLLLLLVAAAVVLPVVFVVLPKQDSNNDASPVGSCERKLTCENGGANILSSNGYCECICRNGYYGTTCSNAAVQGCTTTSIGTTDNATLGEAIPRLLEGSQSNYSVPLSGQDLLGLFSSSDMSCVSQNALVTFNTRASKRSGRVADKATQRAPLMMRELTGSTVTRDGIVYATGSPTASSWAPTATSNGPIPGNGGTSGTSESQTTLDFARVAVLYVLQASGDISLAATAQEKLQSYFRGEQAISADDTNPANITLSGTFSCDLTAYTINIGNGTTVGGGPG